MSEHQTIEWKEVWRDEYLKWICGFANVVEAHPYPVSYKGEYHYRSGSTKQELKGAALDAFLLKKHGVRWDAVPVPNYGQLPEHWTLERLLGKHPSNPFNPLIANTFFRCGYIESWGRGIEKIRRECEKWGIPSPEYDYGMSGLMLTFHANPAQLAESLGKVSVKTSVETTEMSVKTSVKTPERIVAILTENPNLTLAEVANILGKTLRTVERATAKLVKEERLHFIGSRKAGHWEVTP